jgi:hypothetical protein
VCTAFDNRPAVRRLARVNRRPTSLIVVSVVWLLLGAWQLLGASVDLFDIIRLQIEAAGGTTAAPLAPHLGTFIVGGWLVVLLKWALAVLIIVSAYFLWRLRGWARKSLEVVSWGFLTLLVGAAGYWMYVFLEASSKLPPSVRSSFDPLFWRVIAVVVVLVNVLVVSVGLLRSTAMRRAVASARPEVDGGDQLTPSARRFVVPSVPS